MKAEDILAAGQTNAELGGVSVRKGTVAAFVANARAWSDPSTSPQDRKSIESDIRDAMPALKGVGLFDIFTLKDAKLQAFISSV